MFHEKKNYHATSSVTKSARNKFYERKSARNKVHKQN